MSAEEYFTCNYHPNRNPKICHKVRWQDYPKKTQESFCRNKDTFLAIQDQLVSTMNQGRGTLKNSSYSLSDEDYMSCRSQQDFEHIFFKTKIQFFLKRTKMRSIYIKWENAMSWIL